MCDWVATMHENGEGKKVQEKSACAREGRCARKSQSEVEGEAKVN